MPHSLNCLRVLKDKRLREFINFVLREGWHVKLTPGGNIQIERKGFATIYTAGYLIEKAQYTPDQRIKYPVFITRRLKRKIYIEGGQNG